MILIGVSNLISMRYGANFQTLNRFTPQPLISLFLSPRLPVFLPKPCLHQLQAPARRHYPLARAAGPPRCLQPGQQALHWTAATAQQAASGRAATLRRRHRSWLRRSEQPPHHRPRCS